MIYELRVYQPVPGQMPKLLARFRDKLLPIWERHGIRPIGFWTTLVGESSNELTYILQWELSMPALSMSALGGKADIYDRLADVR